MISFSFQRTEHTNTSIHMSLSRCYPLKAQNLALHKSPGKCLPGLSPTHPTWATAAQEGPSQGYYQRGSTQGPQCTPGVARQYPLTIYLFVEDLSFLPCPAPKVTFPAPSSDGCLNSSFSSFGAKEGRKDPQRT